MGGSTPLTSSFGTLRREMVHMWIGVFLLTLLTADVLADDRKLVIGGTGGALGAMSELATAFKQLNPGIEIEVLPSLGSSGGVRALAARKVDIALSARLLKDEERNGTQQVIPYAKTPMVFATPISNPATNITTEDLVKIVSGELTTWPDGTPIGLVIRQEHDSETTKMISMSPLMPAALERARNRVGVPVGSSVQNAAELIQNHKGGLGSSNLAVILTEKRPLKSLSLDGVEPSEEAILAGAYTLFESLFMIVDTKPRDDVKAYVDFVLSPAGAEILRRTGHAVVEN